MANKFLKLVAKDLLQKYGNNLSQVTVVMPGKRARLFMNQYLAELSDKPVWSPRYQTIDELFLELSPYRKAEQIETVCLLYKIYTQLVDDAKPLDEFYSWGEIILSDFDDIDKHLAPAHKIFANVFDLNALEQAYLTEDQEKALKEFFGNFNQESLSVIKERFLRLWNVMPHLYDKLKEALKEKGYLYSGALYRDVVERFSMKECGEQTILEEMQKRTYAFVGFNVVDECEASLFRLLGEEHTLFYWDYDEMYMKDVKFKTGIPSTNGSNGYAQTATGAPWEAGLFIRQNLSAFPNSLPREYFDNLSKLKDITFIATSTDNAQARHIPVWIDQQLTKPENETAIVLCDEHLLQPVLHALPEDKPEQINVTMGFPLSDTPVYSLLSIITSMQVDGWDAVAKRFRNTFVEKVKRHPYYKLIGMDLFVHQNDNLELLTYLQNVLGEIGTYYANRINSLKKKQNEAEKQDLAENVAEQNGAQREVNEDDNKIELDVYDQLYSEAIFQTHKVLNRFITIIEEKILDVHPITLRRLIRNVLTTTSIPFHGEPAIGMQVMGLMETRNLDFKHLLMLNVGEGTMPKKSDDNSLIPYPLREAFGLTTIRHRISVFAYYFFRLLQRTEHVTLMYNENSSGVKNNEMSRFMRQMMAETDLPIRYIRLTPENEQNNEQLTIKADKTAEMIKQLEDRYKVKEGHMPKMLSPTAINTYLQCPMQFYFKYVAGMVVKQKVEDGITPALMGTFFHDSAQRVYEKLAKKYGTTTFTADMLRPLVENKETQLLPLIEMPEFESNSGLPLIIRNVILEYLCQLIRYDIYHAPVTVYKMEEDYMLNIDIAEPGQPSFPICIGGRIDRLDRCENGMKVVDYKTGGRPDTIDSVEAIFKHEKKNAGYFFQTLLYSLAASHKHRCGVKPTLFYVHKVSDVRKYDPSLAFKPSRSEPIVINDVCDYEQEFMDKLKQTVRDIFNPELSFTQTAHADHCEYCDYRHLCGKKEKRS